MFNLSVKATAVIFSIICLPSLASAEILPKQSRDYKGNYNIIINDQKGQPATAICVATTYDLKNNKNYKYDRFGFTQADFDTVKLNSAGAGGKTTVTIQGEARQRKANTTWDPITVQCIIAKNKIQSISVTTKK